MTEENKEPNTFEEMEKSETVEKPKVQKTENTSINEIDISDFSDTAIGDKVKYNRPELDGKEDVIKNFQIFPPDTNSDPETTQSGKEYWPYTIILTYESVNEDGINNREYIPGCKGWKQKDGSVSDPGFWYKGAAENNNQCGILWEKVAEHLKIKPEEMSPRQFVAFLCSKPDVKIEGVKTKNPMAKAGQPKIVVKNLPGEFL